MHHFMYIQKREEIKKNQVARYVNRHNIEGEVERESGLCWFFNS